MKRYKSLRLKVIESVQELSEDESPFSTNTVTGHSINFPIAQTCSPTKVCGETCYAGCGPITWRASLAKQHRAMESCKTDPEAFANRVLLHSKKLSMPFITWNGSGDLFPESVQAINTITRQSPETFQWVRTRKPAMAGLIDYGPRTFVHFSLDRWSIHRAHEVEWKTTNFHYSYQYDSGETGRNYPVFVKIIFGHDYKLPKDFGDGVQEVCPLNVLDDITGACVKCRRCFGGNGETK